MLDKKTHLTVGFFMDCQTG